MRPLRIALVGDFDPEITAHQAIQASLRLAAASDISIEWDWLPTPSLAVSTESKLSHDGVWCVPGSPYRSEDGAIAAIRLARERNTPFLGSCGGCQHAILEYARDVLGLTEAQHAEQNPEATLPLISLLSCSLVEVGEEIALAPGSLVHRIYGAERVRETYHCRYGLNPALEHLLAGSGLEITRSGRAWGGASLRDEEPAVLRPHAVSAGATRSGGAGSSSHRGFPARRGLRPVCLIARRRRDAACRPLGLADRL